jgi:rRNA-processing protein FCF1
MQLLISDANILIDMEDGQLLEKMFTLPYQFRIPDALFFDELETMHPDMLALGLQLGSLNAASVQQVMRLVAKYPQPSRYDCMALALAKQGQCPLLTGDRHLKRAAEKEGVLVQGTLWIVEQLLTHGIVTLAEARQSYQRMRARGRRLPWDMAFKRLESL